MPLVNLAEPLEAVSQYLTPDKIEQPDLIVPVK